MRQDDPDSLDRLIDDVAREMTAARADDRFARRVSARLEDRIAGAPRTWPRAWLLAPAAVAVLLAGLLLSDRNVRLKPDATAVGKPDATAVSQPDATAVSQPDATAVQRGATAVSEPGATVVGKPDATPNTVVAEIRPPDAAKPITRLATTTAQESVASPPAADFPVEPLVTPPIEFAALDVSPLVTAMPIEIQAIAIDRIEIPPMP